MAEGRQFDRVADVRGRYGWSTPTVDRREADRLITRALRIHGVRYWPTAELAAIDEARTRGAGDDEVRLLVTELERARTAGRMAA